jgi:hypothetical protein
MNVGKFEMPAAKTQAALHGIQGPSVIYYFLNSTFIIILNF